VRDCDVRRAQIAVLGIRACVLRFACLSAA
jgi:hypothetical protein